MEIEVKRQIVFVDPDDSEEDEGTSSYWWPAVVRSRKIV